ncbi:hypothetical protein J4421_00170 [Candidatus Woesearchaeota archaeon]|nr:hypothetical protein [Candidatus Woesearchaeota archaeon]
MKRDRIILTLLILGLFFIIGCSSSSYPKDVTDKLANCLAEKEVKEYGAFWCPNCAKQEKMFGKSNFILKEKEVYIECDPRCDVAKEELPAACRGIKAKTSLCLEKKVEKYPTWEFKDGTRIVGVQPLETIAQKAGCAFA